MVLYLHPPTICKGKAMGMDNLEQHFQQSKQVWMQSGWGWGEKRGVQGDYTAIKQWFYSACCLRDASKSSLEQHSKQFDVQCNILFNHPGLR